MESYYSHNKVGGVEGGSDINRVPLQGGEEDVGGEPASVLCLAFSSDQEILTHGPSHLKSHQLRPHYTPSQPRDITHSLTPTLHRWPRPKDSSSRDSI